MQRTIIIALVALLIPLAAALLILLWRSQPSALPISVDAADENMVDPYVQEMNCIDRLMQNNELLANQVNMELARCQGSPPGRQGNGQ